MLSYSNENPFNQLNFETLTRPISEKALARRRKKKKEKTKFLVLL
jgi:hypothetical protein